MDYEIPTYRDSVCCVWWYNDVHMESFKINNHQENIEEPFVLEQASIEPVSKVAIEGGTLFVNGLESEKYGWVDFLKKQKSGISTFTSHIKGDYNAHHVFIDPSNPDRVFPRVDFADNRVTVDGFEWKSLQGKDNFFSGLLMTVDPVNGSIVGHTQKTQDKKAEVIVDNIPWQHTFDSVSSAESKNGTVCAFVNKDGFLQKSLFVNDREWSVPVNPETKGSQQIVDGDTNGNGIVAVFVQSNKKQDGTIFEYICVGDTKGSQKEWKTEFDASSYDKRHHMAIDENSDTTAVIGKIKGVPTLVIDDTPCKLSFEPHKIEHFRISNGEVFVQYINSQGKQYAETVSLREDASEIKAKREQWEKNEDNHLIIRDLIHKQNISAEKIIDQLTNYEKI